MWAVDENGDAILAVRDGRWIIHADGSILEYEKRPFPPTDPPTGSIDLLCATYKKRRGWMEFMLASFDAQYAWNKRLIICDLSSAPNYDMQRIGKKREDVVYVWAPDAPGRNLGWQRNKLLDMVEADWFAWFDDDEVRSSFWIHDLIGSWNGKATVVTPKQTMFVDATPGGKLRIKPYQVPTVSSQSAIFQRSVAGRHRCSTVYQYEEVPWLRSIVNKERVQRVDGCWVWQIVHGENIGNTWERIFG